MTDIAAIAQLGHDNGYSEAIVKLLEAARDEAAAGNELRAHALNASAAYLQREAV